MFKKLTALFIFGLIVFSCKKETTSNTPPDTGTTYVDVTGSWKVQKETDVAPGQTTVYSADDFPCMANQKISFSANKTATAAFTGTETCYLSQNGSYSIIYGEIGKQYDYTWTQIKDSVTIIYPVTGLTSKAVTSTKNNIDYLTFQYHNPDVNTTYITVYVRE